MSMFVVDGVFDMDEDMASQEEDKRQNHDASAIEKCPMSRIRDIYHRMAKKKVKPMTPNVIIYDF